MPFVIDSIVTKNYEAAKDREWIITNGLGSYASSTIIGLNTKCDHGLLVAALNPPSRRVLFLSKLEEEIEVGNRKYLLAVNKYPGAIYPQGLLHLEQFRFDRYPIFVYKVGNTILEKSVFMPHEDNTTIATYKIIEAESPVRISIHPIVNHRNCQEWTHEDPRWNFTQTLNPKGVELRAFPGAVTLYLQSDIASYTPTGYWYKNFVYETSESGKEEREDQYNPGFFSIKLEQGSQVSVLASLRPQSMFSIEGLRYREMQRIRSLMSKQALTDSFFESLVSVADTFLVKKRSTNLKSVIAGYRSFGESGRDAMISIPGLTLVTKREEEGKEIILNFLRFLKDGLVPNSFSDTDGEPDYQSIDTSLWLIYACYMIYAETGSLDYVAALYPKFQEIIDAYVKGARFGIRMDADGLIAGGSETTALTWMNARSESVPVTPRFGKPVEVSALWYNALRTMERFASDLNKQSDAENYQTLAEKSRISFNDKFWDGSKGCLHDVIMDGKGDGTTRPNQIFAISLPFPVLDGSRWRSVLRIVEAELLTPVGLRSLSALDPAYKGVYSGSGRERSLVRHQGTAWPWLFGPFVTAYAKVFHSDLKTLGVIRELFTPFRKRMLESGVGTVSEIYDGDPPHIARGCISQAWSVAELLRTYARDAYQL